MASVWPLLNRARIYGIQASQGDERHRPDLRVLIPINIQYAADTYPALEGFEAHQNLFRGSQIRPPFDHTWYEWSENDSHFPARTSVEPYDCCAMTNTFDDRISIEGYWFPRRMRRRGKRMTIPIVYSMDIPYERLDGDFGKPEDWKISLHEWDQLTNLGSNERDLAMHESLAITLMILWSWLLLSCNNVTTVEIHPSTRRKKAENDSSRIIYREITIAVPPCSRSRPGGKPRDDEAGVAFHVRRGHFADYTKGKGLFGKHHGRYWIPPTTAGNVAHGEVIKSYSLGGERSKLKKRR